ncbi:MAG: hypothetical protein ACRDIY_09500 [Chloroflexota bacterium]
MNSQTLTRRKVLKLSGALALAVPILAACSGTSTPAATPATSAPASSSPSASTGATATAAPASQAAPAGGKISLSIGTESGESLNWQRDFAKQWADKNPDVTLRIDTVTYGDAQTKTMSAIAAGTLQDISYAACKWFPLPAAKNAYRAIDDYVKTKDPGMSDFFPGAIDNSTYKGKLFGLPYDFDNGNYAVVTVNLDLFAAKGVTPPTDDMNVQDFAETAAKVTDQANKVFGTDYLCGTYYDFSALARTWGTDIISSDGTKFQFATDPKSTAAAQWQTDLRVKYKAAPLKASLQSGPQGAGFPAGKLATSFEDINTVLGLGDTVGNKFKWDAVLFPKGMTGNRSFYIFSSCFGISAKSKAPEKAYDLIVYEASTDAGIAGLVKDHFAPNPRFSTWQSPEVGKLNPIFTKVLGWLKDPSGPTNFPLPGNARYAELQDKWSNLTQPLFYGDVPFEQGMKAVQDACQGVLDLPFP